MVTPKRAPPEARPIASGVGANSTLADVAETVLSLQEARHLADYDHLVDFTKTEVLQVVDAARDAVSKLRSLAGTSDVQRFFSILALRQSLK